MIALRFGAGAGRLHDRAQQEVHGREQQRVEDDPELTDRGVVVLGLEVGAREVPDEAAAAPELGEVRAQRRQSGRGRLVDRRDALRMRGRHEASAADRAARQGARPAPPRSARLYRAPGLTGAAVARPGVARAGPTPRPAPARPTGPTTTAPRPPTARPRPRLARARRVVAEPAQRGRELRLVAGRARAPRRHRRGAARAASPARGAITARPGREVLGELERRVVEGAIARREHEARRPSRRGARGSSSCATVPVHRTATPRSRASRSTRARSGPSPTSSSVVSSSPATASTACSSAWKRRKLPIQPTTNRPSSPSRPRAPRRDRAARGTAPGRRPVGVITMRRSSTPMRRTCSATASDPHATTSAARNGARSPTRSIHGPQPGRRTPHCCACHTSGAGTNTTDGTPSARARRGPAVWNSSCRCHTHAMSCPRHGPAGSMWNAARALPLARVLHRGLRDDGDAVVPPRHATRPRAMPRRRAPAQLVGHHHAFGRDDPHVAEEAAQPARPPRRAHPRRDRTLLPGGDRREHEDRARAPAVRRDSAGGFHRSGAR